MASSNCECGDKSLGNWGSRKCVTEMAAVAFPFLFPYYDENGDPNTFNVSSPTLGQDIKDLIQTSSDTFRIYPMPRVEEFTAERTETVYQTFSSQRKVKIPGVGGVRTFAMQIIGKDATNAVLRESEKYGCTDLGFGFVDVNGNIWLYKDNPDSTEARGWKMDTETFDAFRNYASDTTVASISVSFDLARYDKESHGYVITSNELGYSATDLSGLVSAFFDAEAATSTTITLKAYTGFGTAANLDEVVGMVSANFVGQNENDNTPVVFTSVETADGEYTLTFTAQTAGDVISINGDLTGFDFEESRVVAL